MPRPCRWRVTHVLEHVPTPGCNAKGRQIPKVNALLCAPTKDVHCVIYEGRRMAFPSHGYVANAVQF